MQVDLKKRRTAFSVPTLHVILSVFVVIFPTALIATFFPGRNGDIGIILYTSLGCFFAILLTAFILRNISYYPGVENITYVLPTFCASCALVLLAFTMMRIPYSRSVLIITFFLNILIFVVLYGALRKREILRIGLVPQESTLVLATIPRIEWRILSGPDDPVDDLDAIAVDLWSDVSDEWERKLASFALSGLPVYHSKHLRESLTGKVEIEMLSENNFGTLSPLYAYMAVKQFLDWVLALTALVVLLPLLAAVAVLIKLDSPGPIFFVQTRIGYRGKPFRVFKFRTMTVGHASGATDIDARDAAMTKDGDQRITRIGKFLRHSRIDELPQILNVLKGEMSWIGPRPEAEVLSRWYEHEIPFYRYRHIVRPGITGWAQVHQGHVAAVYQVREKLHFDFYYIKNFSPWIDIVVVARTIRAVITGFGSK